MTRKILTPTSVKIGYKTYKIRPFSRGEIIDNDHYWGRIIHATAIIRFDAKMERRGSAAILLHEILHGIAFTTHQQLKEEEEVVRAMTDGLCGVMRDNPDLFKWILKELK